jgi:Mrp family chromosome partitioning ATPase
MGIFTDANVLISRADAALLVVRAGKTRYALVDKLLEQLPKERLLGVILNRADETIDSTAYYYQQRYNRRDRVVPSEPITVTNEQPSEAAIIN